MVQIELKEKKQRQELLSVLAKSSVVDIQTIWDKLGFGIDYVFLKKPEIGMMMVRAKADGDGNEFNMGEVTVTRCVVKLSTNQMGFGHCVGRDKTKAELIAVIDACFQVDAMRNIISHDLLEALKHRMDDRNKKVAVDISTSKVDFFTMVRGE